MKLNKSTHLFLKKLTTLVVMGSLLFTLIVPPLAQAKTLEQHQTKTESYKLRKMLFSIKSEEDQRKVIELNAERIGLEKSLSNRTQNNGKKQSIQKSGILPWTAGLAVTLISLYQKLPAWAQGTASQSIAQPAASPQQNYLPLIILATIGGAVGIAVAARYHLKKMKDKKQDEIPEVSEAHVATGDQTGEVPKPDVESTTREGNPDVLRFPRPSIEDKMGGFFDHRMSVLEGDIEKYTTMTGIEPITIFRDEQEKRVKTLGRIRNLWNYTKDHTMGYINEYWVRDLKPFEIEIVEEIKAAVVNIDHYIKEAGATVKVFSGPGLVGYPRYGGKMSSILAALSLDWRYDFKENDKGKIERRFIGNGNVVFSIDRRLLYKLWVLSEQKRKGVIEKMVEDGLDGDELNYNNEKYPPYIVYPEPGLKDYYRTEGAPGQWFVTKLDELRAETVSDIFDDRVSGDAIKSKAERLQESIDKGEIEREKDKTIEVIPGTKVARNSFSWRHRISIQGGQNPTELTKMIFRIEREKNLKVNVQLIFQRAMERALHAEERMSDERVSKLNRSIASIEDIARGLSYSEEIFSEFISSFMEQLAQVDEWKMGAEELNQGQTNIIDMIERQFRAGVEPGGKYDYLGLKNIKVHVYKGPPLVEFADDYARQQQLEASGYYKRHPEDRYRFIYYSLVTDWMQTPSGGTLYRSPYVATGGENGVFIIDYRFINGLLESGLDVEKYIEEIVEAQFQFHHNMRAEGENNFVRAHGTSYIHHYDFKYWGRESREIFARVSKEILPLAAHVEPPSRDPNVEKGEWKGRISGVLDSDDLFGVVGMIIRATLDSDFEVNTKTVFQASLKQFEEMDRLEELLALLELSKDIKALYPGYIEDYSRTDFVNALHDFVEEYVEISKVREEELTPEQLIVLHEIDDYARHLIQESFGRITDFKVQAHRGRALASKIAYEGGQYGLKYILAPLITDRKPTGRYLEVTQYGHAVFSFYIGLVNELKNLPTTRRKAIIRVIVNDAFDTQSQLAQQSTLTRGVYLPLFSGPAYLLDDFGSNVDQPRIHKKLVNIAKKVAYQMLATLALAFFVYVSPSLAFDGSVTSMVQDWSQQFLSVIGIVLSYVGLQKLQNFNVSEIGSQKISKPTSNRGWMRLIARHVGDSDKVEQIINPSIHDLVTENLLDGNVRAVVNIMDLKEEDVISKLKGLNDGISREEGRKFIVSVMWSSDYKDRRFTNKDQIKRYLERVIGSSVEVHAIKMENNLFNLGKAIEIIEKESSSIDYSLVVINKGNHWDMIGLLHKVLEITFREEGLEATQHNFEAEGQFAVNQ